MKQYYETIFVVLVYRNIDDLEDFLKRTKEKVANYKVIVVDAYYNNNISERIKQLADEYECDYLCVENNGYSYGNNQGIKFAIENYEYGFIVISNPDILIENYDDSNLSRKGITAPEIINASGKHQNPMKPFHSYFSDKCCYVGFKKNSKFFLIIGRGVNKIYRWIWLFLHMINKKYKRIYAAHGSFLIISSDALKKLGRNIFDEKMFLFSEEDVLACKAEMNQVIIEYNDSISVLHKEDGSMKLGNISQSSENYKSYVYYYEKYVKGSKTKKKWGK